MPTVTIDGNDNACTADRVIFTATAGMSGYLLTFAKITQFLLNKKETQNFIQSFIFTDTKRTITKDQLMRIDLKEIAQTVSYEQLNSSINIEDWNNYLKLFDPKKQQQLNFLNELEPPR